MGVIKFNNVPSTTPGLEVETFPNYVAPEKEYQVTHVPGRNGDLVVDTKTYKNVPRSYKVSMAVEPPAVSVSGSTASFEATAERALAECKTAISSDIGKVGTTIINSATDPVENNEPYNFRAVPNGVGDRENDTLIGGTVAWNQIEKTDASTATVGSITFTNLGNGKVRVTGTFNGTRSYKYMDTVNEVPARPNDIILFLYSGDTLPSGCELFLSYYNGSTWLSGEVLTSTKKSVMKKLPTNTTKIVHSGFDVSVRVPTGTVLDYTVSVNTFNLTQMFGSTIADYIYGLETATAGAGVAWFRNLFPKDYYAYNAGELISVKTEAHKTTGKNIFPLVAGTTKTSNGITWKVENDLTISVKGKATGRSYFSLLTHSSLFKPNTYTYLVEKSGTNADTITWLMDSYYKGTYTYRRNEAYPSHETFIVTNNDYISADYSMYFDIPSTAAGTTFNCKLKLQVEIRNQATTYEPYEEHIYPLNPALELRGIPKLNSSNKLYYDGDIYSSDGSIIRKYGIVDLGTLTYGNYESTYNRFATTIMDIKSYSVRANPFICSRFQTIADGRAIADVPDNSVYNGTTTTVYFKTTAYSDATAFKTAMSGVYLIYELATPVIESTSGLIDNVSIASFDDGADNEPVNSLVVDITATESGSGEKSPTNPYSISGFDSGIITRLGANLWSSGDVTFTRATYEVPISLTPKTYYFSAIITTTDTDADTCSLVVYYTDNTYLVVSGLERDKRIFTSFTTTKDVAKIALYSSDNYAHGSGDTATWSDILISENGTTYTFTFGQKVYGGYFDNKGNLVNNRGELVLSSLNWYYSTNGYFEASINIDCPTRTQWNAQNGNCGIYTIVSMRYITNAADRVNNSIAWYSNVIRVADNSTTDVATFVTNLQNQSVYYELATPITLSITSQDIPTLLGVNNIFSNTGNIKSLSYPKQVCPFEPAQEVDDHGTEEYVDNREVAIPVGHESKYFTAGKIYNFSWSDEAGLIKEGELNADTGVLTITDGYKVIDIGDISWVYNASRVSFSTAISDIKTVSSGTIGNMSCSIYTVSPAISSTTDIANKPDMTIFQQKNNTSVFIKNLSFTDAETFKSAMHGVKLLYELDDPVRTIQLTPVQVESLIGNNVLISESGNISVTPRTYSTYTEKMNAISDWLHSASGYARLEDTYEPDYYRKAYYDEQTDMENIFNEAGQATLNFICKPQRYLKSGEEPITISSGGLIQNRTRYEAYPILKVTTNNTQGSVAIGNHSITIKAGAGTYSITIDCELQDAWSGTSNKNSYIVLNDGEFPVIDPGTQTVTFDGGVQSVEVIPRWWTV